MGKLFPLTAKRAALTAGKHWCLPALVGLMLALGGGAAQAAVDADPSKDYHVTPAEGPWMICVTSYMGAAAPKLAHDLVLEIRQRYRQPAFIFNRGAEERAKQQQELEAQRRQQQAYLQQMGYNGDLPLRHRTVRIEEQYAVLIGGYKDIDTANAALKTIKKLEAPQSVPKDTYSIRQDDAPGGESKPFRHEVVNPFATSFVVRNPTVPAEESKPDPAEAAFLKKLNADEPLSLLNCKHSWTLAIKVFQGTAVIQEMSVAQSLMDKLLGSNTGVQLDAGGHNAHNLAEALRKMGFEAYVLHTRYNSVVSVGAFDRPDDPRMKEIERALADNVQVNAGSGNLPGQFDQGKLQQQVQPLAHPLPMPVPQP